MQHLQPQPRAISIWQPYVVDGDLLFIRPDPLPLGDHHAPQKVLRARKPHNVRRICLFGESAAAGYLYAPHVTPAKVLEAQLHALIGRRAFEVVDLTRTNEALAPLVATLDASLQLHPDLLVVFTGNNWNLLETPEVSPYFPSASARRELAEALSQSSSRDVSVLGVIELAARRRLHRAAAALAEIARIADEAAVPVILVVPEVNLADWETRQPVTWLPGQGVPQWYSLLEKLGLLGRAGTQTRPADPQDWEAVVAVAEAMIELDGSTCPTAYRLLATAHKKRGYLELAAAACRAEIDSSQYATLAFMSAPQVTPMDQELLRRAAKQHGFGCVDLPRVFAEATGSPLPGRRLFLDYCHLTLEGMKIGMAAVAAEVLGTGHEEATSIRWQELLPHLTDPIVSSEADATAKLGAAIHTAHRLLSVGPKGPIIEYWCQKALEASPGVEQAMLDLVHARTAGSPAVLTAAMQRNLASPYKLSLQHGWQYDFLDIDLMLSMRSVLARAGREALVAEIDRLLVSRAAVVRTPGGQTGGVELAHPAYYHREPLERFFPEVLNLADLPQQATVRFPWPTASFCLICDAAKNIHVDLTVRLPSLGMGLPGRSAEVPNVANELSGSRGLSISVNNKAVATLAVGPRWIRSQTLLDRRLLHPGVNVLTLHWPMPKAPGEDALAVSVGRLKQGFEADLHPVFGELFSMAARPV